MCPYAILMAFLEGWKTAEKKSFAGVFETEEEARAVHEKVVKEKDDSNMGL